jgi:hypothetical protein
MTKITDDISRSLVDGWCSISTEYAPNACILATRVGIEVLRYFGVPASAVSTALCVLNAEYITWQQAGSQEPLPPEAHSIGVDPAAVPTQPRYRGHLVLVTDDNTMIDLTLPQVNRPHKGIELQPLVARVPKDFRTNTSWFATKNAGCEVAYQPFDDRTYKEAPDWRNHKDLVGPLIRYIKETIS